MDYYNTEKYIDNNTLTIINMLEKDGFINKDETNKYKLSQKGILATHLREIHCLIFANLFQNNFFNELSSKQLVAIFSCFTNISINNELVENVPSINDKIVENIVIQIKEMYIEYKDKEIINYINSGIDYTIHFDLLYYVLNWCDCECIEDCKFLLQNLENEKGIFLGEFVKALLKINNISGEMEKIAELTGNIQLLSKLKEIPNMTLKYIVTTQSLYV